MHISNLLDNSAAITGEDLLSPSSPSVGEAVPQALAMTPEKSTEHTVEQSIEV